MSASFLVANEVVKSYGNFKALNGFSFDMPNGVIGLLGPNGAGKTTFIRALLGIHPIDSGTIQFGDYELPRDILKVKDLIGYSPEVATKILKTNAQKFATHMGRLSGLPAEAAKQRAFDVLHYVGLGEARYRDMDTFSQGMLQKAKLATALIHDPDVLLLDEPTAGTDPESREQILDLIYDLGKNHGKNIIMCTHLLPDIEKNANYVVVISQGKTVMQGSLEEVMKPRGEQVLLIRVSTNQQQFASTLEKNGYKVLSVRSEINIQMGNDPSFSSIFKLAKAQGVAIRMITPFKQRLEDVFVDVVTDDLAEVKG